MPLRISALFFEFCGAFFHSFNTTEEKGGAASYD